MNGVKRTRPRPSSALPGDFLLIAFCALAVLAIPGRGKAQDQPKAQEQTDNTPQKKSQTYLIKNGTETYQRTEETERRRTADGEVEIQRVRMPSYAGDRGVLMEREIRTKKLPDGSIEKEIILKNPDGGGVLTPTEITRQHVTKSGNNVTVDSEVLKPDPAGGPDWRTTRRERTTETGPEASRVVRSETLERNISGDWRVVSRETTTAKSAPGVKESQTTREIPDAYGKLAPYETRQERVVTREGQETHQVTLRRRDFQDTDASKFYLVEQTTSDTRKTPSGATTHTETKSDLVDGGAARSVQPGSARVVEVTDEKTTKTADGSEQKVVTVQQRTAGDPHLRPSYQVKQETDSTGHVRQVFIPSNP